MSYTSKDATVEFDAIIAKAVERDDEETLHKWANALADTDPEFASHIRDLALRAENNNWAHDRAKDNE